MSSSEPEGDYRQMSGGGKMSGTAVVGILLWILVSIGVIVFDWYHYQYAPVQPGAPKPAPVRSTGWRYFVNICVGSIILLFVVGGGMIGYSLKEESSTIRSMYWFIYITTMWALVYAGIYKYYLEPNKRTNKDRDKAYTVACYWLAVAMITLIFLGCAAGGDSCIFLLLASMMR
jgi:hypothetical protein